MYRVVYRGVYAGVLARRVLLPGLPSSLVPWFSRGFPEVRVRLVFWNPEKCQKSRKVSEKCPKSVEKCEKVSGKVVSNDVRIDT